MKNKLLIISFAMMISTVGLLSACSTEKEVINVNVESVTENTVLGNVALIEIGNLLYYDSSTGIVYWWNGVAPYAYSSTVPTPYYSPNGYLYRFNPQTNTFEEIIPEDQNNY